jgi:hypothetical protein
VHFLLITARAFHNAQLPGDGAPVYPQGPFTTLLPAGRFGDIVFGGLGA